MLAHHVPGPNEMTHAPVRAADDASATRWAAVQARDWRRDGTFVYAVTSTGIYCRPSCASRRPARSNVRFFDQPADAEQAGFRACLRCAPRERTTGDVRAVERVRAWLDTHPGQPARLATLARVAQLSPFHLQRTFKRLVGLTPREYAAARRQQALRRTLKAGQQVTDAIYEAGYGSASRAYDEAGRLGMTPGAFRRGGEGQRVFFDVAPSAAGLLLVAATPRGLCFVGFGESDTALSQRLAAEYPRAVLERAPERLRPWVDELLRRVAEGETRVALPLDVKATAFQRQVWRALSRIPPGETRTYAGLARSLGRPSASRAVSRACAANPVAVAVPCHRVVPASGGTGGYRWGAERKAALLDAETRAPKAHASRRERPRG